MIIDPHLYDLRRAHYDVEPLPGYLKLGGEDVEEDAEALDNEATYNIEVAPSRAKKPAVKKQRVTGPDSKSKKGGKTKCQLSSAFQLHRA